MESVRNLCAQIVDNLEGGLACGVVSLRTNELFAVYNKVTGKRTLSQVVVDALVEMFRGPKLVTIEKGVRAQRGAAEDGGHYFKEYYIVSTHNLHFAQEIANGNAAIMLITSKSTSFDDGWRQLRQYIPSVEATLTS